MLTRSLNIAVSYFRKVLVPHKLSTGHTLPPGAMIAFPAGPMAASSEYHPSPKSFDGLRHYRMRQSKDTSLSSNAHQFTTTSFGHMMFGHGKLACPGRFYADLQMKMVLAQLLLRYDLKLSDGCKRPENIYFADASVPDQTCQIQFRGRIKHGS